MNKLALVAIIAPLFALGCEKSEFEKAQEPIIEKMEWLYTAKPREMFLKAINKGDHRFYGVYGISLKVPHVDLKCLDVKKDVIPIKGTADAHLGYEHEKLNAIAWVFASSYNIDMQIYLMEKGEFKCDS